jgi:lysyl-tRNA synthetase class 2
MSRQSKIRENLELRANILTSIRGFFQENNYLEVETPYRIPAPAPEMHIDAQPSGGWFLHTSPELCMKQLLAAGYPRVYQICKCFRKRERGSRHLPELTMLEWYTTGDSYLDMMVQLEEMVAAVAKDLGRPPDLPYQGGSVNLAPPWERLTVGRAFEKYAGVPVAESIANGMFDETLALDVEPRLGNARPLFLYDYPAACGSLARRKPGSPHLVERFELYIRGMEICNAFSELTDPLEQRARFEEEARLRVSSGKAAYPLPETFLKSLEKMPPAAGNALGIDRLVMLFADTGVIDDVVAFTPEEL